MQNDKEDLEVEDFLNQKSKRKGINSGDKGKRTERLLVDLMNNRFGGGFSRSIGSGNRVEQVFNMPKHAKDTFTGDLVCPENFRFTLECKGGYDDIDLNFVFAKGHSQIDAFLTQADEEADCGRKPILVWKKNRKPWISFVRTDELPHLNWNYRLIYREWSAVPLLKLLELPDEWFYTK